MLKIDGCHFCLFSIEVLMEFISSPILKKQTLVKVVAVIGRDSPVGWTFVFELQKIWARWNIFPPIKPLRMVCIIVYFWESGIMDLVSHLKHHKSGLI